ncbi:hypothetical protein ACXYMX_05545 [Sporosarcina sp. CAU 1771]
MKKETKVKREMDKMRMEASTDFIEVLEEKAKKQKEYWYAGPKDYRKALIEKSQEILGNNERTE